MQISREYNFPEIEITESGCTYLDTPYAGAGGYVPDTRRIDFFRSYLGELNRAIRDGAKVRAYHAWTLLDNFEWAGGHSRRYGLPTLISGTSGGRSKTRGCGTGASLRPTAW